MNLEAFQATKFKLEEWYRAQKRVLIIDHDPLARDVLRLVFETDGYYCEEANTGIVGFSILQNLSVNLIILDTALPDFTGVEFLNRLSHLYQVEVPPVIFVASQLTQELKRQAFRAGAQVVLTKPYDLHALQAATTGLLIRVGAKMFHNEE